MESVVQPTSSSSLIEELYPVLLVKNQSVFCVPDLHTRAAALGRAPNFVQVLGSLDRGFKIRPNHEELAERLSVRIENANDKLPWITVSHCEGAQLQAGLPLRKERVIPPSSAGAECLSDLHAYVTLSLNASTSKAPPKTSA